MKRSYFEVIDIVSISAHLIIDISPGGT